MHKQINTILRTLLLLVLAMGFSLQVLAKTSEADVVTFQLPDGSDAAGDVVGKARLMRNHQGITLHLRTTGLSAGYAYTFWWIIFNHPGACAASCGGSDFGNPDVEASVLNATGRIADAHGNLTTSAFLPVGFIHTNPSSGNVRQPFGPGLQNLKGAEVHVVVRSHGLATANVEQISTLFGDCNADDGMGNMVCFDPQAAAFPLP